ncbi:MAG: Inner spore coat protein [Verrucomicrobiales bacterium]|nr:Inner spore coat protein [Verrucomicrobiales bacterium]
MSFLRKLLLVSLLIGPALLTKAGVVINEVFYKAPNDAAPLQYVELWNFGQSPVSIEGWKLKQGVKFTFPAKIELKPYGFIIVANNPESFKKVYSMEAVGPFTGKLSDEETISLEDNSGKVIDKVSYKTGDGWPMAADGFSASLERISPNSPALTSQNWASSKWAIGAMAGGSPGKTNHTFEATLIPRLNSASLEPKVSPPGSEITLSATVPPTANVKQVTAYYREVKTGIEAPEKTLALVGKDLKYSGTIKPPTSGIYRVRFKLETKEGQESWYPGVNEPHPALSFAITEIPKPGKISSSFVYSIGTNDLARMKKGAGRYGYNEDDQTRWKMINEVMAGVPIFDLWSRLLGVASFSMKDIEKLKPLFQKEFANQKSRINKIADADDLESIQGDLANESEKARKDFKAELQKATSPEFFKVVDARLSRTNVSGLDSSVEGILDQAVEVGFPLWVVTTEVDSKDEQLEKHKALVEVALAKRDKMREPIKNAVQGKGDWGALREESNAFAADFKSRMNGSLSDAEQETVKKGMEKRLFAGLQPRPVKVVAEARPNSAFLYFETNGVAELFDYVQIVPRAAGYKVHFTKLQPFHGMSTINVIFESDDRYVLAEPLAFDLYHLLNVPGCLTDFTRITVNGKLLGYHLIIEQPNHSFLRRNGLKQKGNLYKATWMGQGVAGTHEKKTNPQDGYKDLEELVKDLEATKTKPAEQWALIKARFDVPEMAKYYAVNTVLSHWDGFFNNYYLFHDIGGTGKWSMFAWDQDKTWGEYDGKPREAVWSSMPLTFGMEGDLPPNAKKDYKPDPGQIGAEGASWWRPGGYISRPLLANPEFRKVYLKEVKAIAEKEYTEETFKPIMARYRDLLLDEVKIRATALGQKPEDAVKLLDANLDSLMNHLVARRKWLLEQPEIKAL